MMPEAIWLQHQQWEGALRHQQWEVQHQQWEVQHNT
jgi:hypothetical protein